MTSKTTTQRTKEIKIMKTKFYWVALLASAALIGQAQGGPHGGGGGMGGGFGGGGRVGGGGGRAGPVGGGFRGGGFHAAAPAFEIGRASCRERGGGWAADRERRGGK